VLLVGGGRIAEGRLHQLLEAGARVHLIAPEVTEAVHRLAAEGRFRLSPRPYQPGDCEGAFVVFTATDAPGVNLQVVAEARSRGILVNAADVPELCDFYVPSMERRGPVVIAVSTSGHAPGLARTIRQKLAATIGPEYGALARLIGRLRRILPPGARRTRQLQALIDGGAAELLARGDRRAVWRLVRQSLRSSSTPPSGEAHASGVNP
jgi:precorrin-2 dehydrogenase/sirohydrochlorin ferrochelatase